MPLARSLAPLLCRSPHLLASINFYASRLAETCSGSKTLALLASEDRPPRGSNPQSPPDARTTKGAPDGNSALQHYAVASHRIIIRRNGAPRSPRAERGRETQRGAGPGGRVCAHAECFGQGHAAGGAPDFYLRARGLSGAAHAGAWWEWRRRTGCVSLRGDVANSERERQSAAVAAADLFDRPLSDSCFLLQRLSLSLSLSVIPDIVTTISVL